MKDWKGDSERMKGLYIIGNGFDLHHNLQTSYGNYCDYLRRNYPTIMKEYERFPYLSYTDSPWSDIEAALCIDYEELLSDEVKHYYPDAMSDSDSRWSDLDVNIEVMTRFVYAFTGDCFFEWLSQLENSKVHADLLLAKDADYINFNYTDTLQRLYGIPEKNILHIHGTLRAVQVANCIGQDVFPSTDLETIEALGPTAEKDKWNSDIIREVIQFGASDPLSSIKIGLSTPSRSRYLSILEEIFVILGRPVKGLWREEQKIS